MKGKRNQMEDDEKDAVMNAQDNYNILGNVLQMTPNPFWRYIIV